VALAREVAGRHGLEFGLVLGVMRVESRFTANVLSPVSAVGLMQVMPLSGRQAGCGDLFEPAANAECGARILKAFLRYYKGNLVLALSGYNAGHAMPDKARKETRVPRNFQYVEDVLRARARYLRFGCDAFD
jgi:soluble lytic murein transglycosylase-like protein